MLLWREAAEYPVFIITESSIIMLFIHFSVPADVMHGKWSIPNVCWEVAGLLTTLQLIVHSSGVALSRLLRKQLKGGGWISVSKTGRKKSVLCFRLWIVPRASLHVLLCWFSFLKNVQAVSLWPLTLNLFASWVFATLQASPETPTLEPPHSLSNELKRHLQPQMKMSYSFKQ